MDLHAIETVILRPNAPTLVKTGLRIELPPGYEAQIRPRSGLALKHGITIPNSPGTVDPSYRGEIGVILLWTGYNPTMLVDSGVGVYKISAGDRIAQMVLARYEPVEFSEEELSDTTRGEGGFGSSGLS